MLLTSAIISGLGLGSMYGPDRARLPHHLYGIDTVNFAQGSALMLGAVLGYTFAVTFGWPMPIAILTALAACALFGLVVERALVRPFVVRGSSSWLMATVAGGILINNVVMFTYGKEPRSFPSMFAVKSISVFGTGVDPLQLMIPVVSVAVAMSVLDPDPLWQGVARRGAEP
jgi:branched-chain amino acid transport system permease protein